MTNAELEAIAAVFDERMQDIAADYLTRMGQHIKELGALKASDIHVAEQLLKMGDNADTIQSAIADAADTMAEDVAEVFLSVAESNTRFAARYFGRSSADTATLNRILQSQLTTTAGSLRNLSQSTVVTDAYKALIDKAIQAVQTGVTDYSSAIRAALKSAGGSGLKVRYESGYTRRLDTAVRQNVLDGVRSLNNDMLRQIGEDYGADGVELSAHALCAEDHLPYQGRQFGKREFEAIQSSLPRQIGTWNCKHTIYPCIMGVSVAANDAETLAAYRANSTEQITIDGTTYTRYQWSQVQRRLETEVRRQKDTAVAAAAAGDMTLRREAQANINELKSQYAAISRAAGLEQEAQRMTVSGFRAVKASG